MARRSSNTIVVPQCKQALEQMKYEIAAELGLTAAYPTDVQVEFAGELGTVHSVTGVNWSSVATREAGSVGGSITRRLIQQAEQTLKGL
ncbi:alpha/beta-type small acid-soluble spore protein [Paenibacillus humicola]|uniref:alpha/beta-type small acid-soluble spore protein n=1 Tax=Paenibacillus humicola TaxID=3110540 RepID=UPI00237A0C60|nr:alpha/beta-type small acid-soluble spore protein [Paenibacillus humicola]